MKPVNLEALESAYHWFTAPSGGAMIGNVITHASGVHAGETLAYFCGSRVGFGTTDLTGWKHWSEIDVPASLRTSKA